jgi:hypothetical protein
LGPTITVTVAAFAMVGWNARNEAIVITTAAMRSEEVFIGSITEELQQSVAARNTGKVTRLLLLQTRRSA